jgi:glutathione S-transferase
MWNAKVEQQGLWAMADAFRNSAKGLADRAVPGPDAYPQIPALADRGRARVKQFFRRLDGFRWRIFRRWSSSISPGGSK